MTIYLSESYLLDIDINSRADLDDFITRAPIGREALFCVGPVTDKIRSCSFYKSLEALENVGLIKRFGRPVGTNGFFMGHYIAKIAESA